jgi:predicted TIM-barrel fold metal-dependent hydrolase
MSEKPEASLPIVPHPVRSAEWLAQSTEKALEPELPIIDAHHHFSPHWGGYFAEDLLRDLGAGHAVESTVYIQCAHGYREAGPAHLHPVGETDFVVKLANDAAKAARAKAPRVAAGIVGYADLRLGDAVDEVLAAHVEAGQGRFRGIRNSGAHHAAFKHGVLPRPPVGLYADAAFRRGYARLAKYGLSFDAWVYHPQLAEVVDLARAFPHIPMVLDHIGGVLGVGPYANAPDAAWKEWLPHIPALAACPNMVVKLGGMGTSTFGHVFPNDRPAPSSEDLAALWRPFFEPVLDAFGAERCMFESNFPVDRSNGSYVVLWNAFKRFAAKASAREKAWLFHDTAARAYRLAPHHAD